MGLAGHMTISLSLNLPRSSREFSLLVVTDFLKRSVRRITYFIKFHLVLSGPVFQFLQTAYWIMYSYCVRN